MKKYLPYPLAFFSALIFAASFLAARDANCLGNGDGNEFTVFAYLAIAVVLMVLAFIFGSERDMLYRVLSASMVIGIFFVAPIVLVGGYAGGVEVSVCK